MGCVESLVKNYDMCRNDQVVIKTVSTDELKCGKQSKFSDDIDNEEKGNRQDEDKDDEPYKKIVLSDQDLAKLNVNMNGYTDNEAYIDNRDEDGRPPKQSEPTAFNTKRARTKEKELVSKNTLASTFAEGLLEEFNLARTNPSKYADKISDMIKYIKLAKSGNGFIFHIPGKAKIGLPTGAESFQKAASYLRTLKPVENLKFSNDIMVDINDKQQDLTKDLIQELILHTRKKVVRKYPNFYVHLDVIGDPEISGLLQIVDDNSFHGRRREAILDSKFNLFSIAQGKDRHNKIFSLVSLA